MLRQYRPGPTIGEKSPLHSKPSMSAVACQGQEGKERRTNKLESDS